MPKSRHCHDGQSHQAEASAGLSPFLAWKHKSLATAACKDSQSEAPRQSWPYKELCHGFSWMRDRAAAETAESSHRAQAGDKGCILSAALKIHDLATARRERPDPTPIQVKGEISDLAGSFKGRKQKGSAVSFPLPFQVQGCCDKTPTLRGF